MRRLLLLLLAGSLAGCAAASHAGSEAPGHGPDDTGAAGSLFIIGGGTRTLALLDRLIAAAGVAPGHGYVVVLPMASAEPDSAIIWSGGDFAARGIPTVGFNVRAGETPTPARLDSLRRASLVYISGGDQARFMDAVAGTGVADAIRDAYRRGAVVAGTSAGAAVMSARMLTGDQRLHPDYEPTYGSVEPDNIDLEAGLGLIGADILVDQHFVVRSRYNRLFTAVIEMPGTLGIGIDESTAILVHAGRAEVVGASQVVVVHNPDRSATTRNGRLGAHNLRVDLYLAGESFALE